MSSFRGTATFRLSPRGLALVDMLGPYVAQAVVETADKPDDRGWVRCTTPIESVEYGVGELMRLGADVEVVAPPALRARMAQSLSETLEHYARQRPPRAAPASGAGCGSPRLSRGRSR